MAVASTAQRALVANIQRFSLHDGGGIRTVAFLKGCPFFCPWCCNPEDISFEPELVFRQSICIHCCPFGPDCLCVNPPERCPTGAKEMVGTRYTTEELFKLLERDRTFYEESGGGITLSGGECLAGPTQAFTIAVAARCRAAGLDTAVETTMSVSLSDPAALVAVTDSLLVDFKIADRARSLSVTGVDPGLRDKNLRLLIGLGAHVIARMPIIPGYTDAADCVSANVRSIRELGIERVDILPFHQLGEGKYDAMGREYVLRGVRQLSACDVGPIVGHCEREGLRVTVYGE